MAENGDQESSLNYSSRLRRKMNKSQQNINKPQHDVNKPQQNIDKPDLGIGNSPTFEEKPKSATGHDVPRREEPISFKHFLNNGEIYRHTGARPKMYIRKCNNTHNIQEELFQMKPTFGKHSKASELSPVLPDFVQDHLVTESYHENYSHLANASQSSIAPENLPNIVEDNSSVKYKNSTCNGSFGHHATQRDTSQACLDNAVNNDIPLDLTGSVTSLNFVDKSPTSTAGPTGAFHLEMGLQKSLPDFLSDRPIHSHSGRHNEQSPFVTLVDETTQQFNAVPCESANSSKSQSSELDIYQLVADLEKRNGEVQSLKMHINELNKRIYAQHIELCEENNRLVDAKKKTVSLEVRIEELNMLLINTMKRAVRAENDAHLLQEDTGLPGEIARLNLDVEKLAESPVMFGTSPQEMDQAASNLLAVADKAEMSLTVVQKCLENVRLTALKLAGQKESRDVEDTKEAP